MWPPAHLAVGPRGNKSFRLEHARVLPLPVALYLRLRCRIQCGIPFHFCTAKVQKEFPPSPGHSRHLRFHGMYWNICLLFVLYQISWDFSCVWHSHELYDTLKKYSFNPLDFRTIWHMCCRVLQNDTMWLTLCDPHNVIHRMWPTQSDPNKLTHTITVYLVYQRFKVL